MRLLVNLDNYQIEKIPDGVTVSREKNKIAVWINFAPQLKISLSHPGVGYVGEPMVAKLLGNGKFLFECDTKPLNLQDQQTLQRKWPSGGWHFLNALNAIEEWLTKELSGGYVPMLQHMVSRLIDNK